MIYMTHEGSNALFQLLSKREKGGRERRRAGRLLERPRCAISATALFSRAILEKKRGRGGRRGEEAEELLKYMAWTRSSHHLCLLFYQKKKGGGGRGEEKEDKKEGAESATVAGPFF